MLTAKELMQLEDFLTLEQSNARTLSHFAGELQDQQAKQMLQQMAQKCQQNLQTVGRHLSGSQNLQ